MGVNVKNPALTKLIRRRRNDVRLCLSVCVTSCSNICPVVAVKSRDSSFNHKICVDLNSHADASDVGSNVLVVHDHEHYIDVYGYESKSGHKSITTVDAAVAYDDLLTGDTSLLLLN